MLDGLCWLFLKSKFLQNFEIKARLEKTYESFIVKKIFLFLES